MFHKMLGSGYTSDGLSNNAPIAGSCNSINMTLKKLIRNTGIGLYYFAHTVFH
jgi:hypothetical protein